MFGLITMLLSTLGATGMGSMLKIIGSIAQSRSLANEARAKRELIRDMSLQKSNAEFNKQCSVKLIKMPVCLLAVLAALLLLSGCSTSQSFQFSAPSGHQLTSSPSHPPKVRKISPSSGDWLFFPHRTRSRQPSQQDTFLWSQLPLWGR